MNDKENMFYDIDTRGYGSQEWIPLDRQGKITYYNKTTCKIIFII